MWRTWQTKLSDDSETMNYLQVMKCLDLQFAVSDYEFILHCA